MPDDVPVRLKPRAIVPAGWPLDVLPNQVITAAHINAIRSSVYAWPGDVDGQGHTLSNVHLAGATGVLADPTTTAGDLIARGAAAIGRFPIGADGQILAVDLAAPAKLKWATPAAAPVLSVFGRLGAVVAAAGDYTVAQVTGALADPTTQKGDLIARGAAAPGRLPAGIDGQVLRVDAAAAAGLRWAGESVPSVFGRTGAIAAQAGDYTAAQVADAVSVLNTYPDPAWITSLSWAKVIGAPATFPAAPHTHDASAIVSGVVAPARLGSGVADATVYLRGDGTWAAAGSGGGGGVISVFGRAGAVIAQSGDYTAAMVTGAVVDPTTSTGDLIVRNNVNALTRLPIGANGQVLQTDTATSVGMKWTTISASVQTPWVTNIDAAGFNLVNVGRLGVAKAVPNYAVDVVGDVNYTGVLRVNGVPVTFGGSQTPWTQNIDASGFALNNVGTLGIGVAAPQSAPLVVASHTPGIAGSVAVQDKDATTAGNPVLLVTGLGSEGSRAWAVGNRGGATYGKDLYVWNDRASDMLFGTNSAERMRITAAGLVGIGTAAPTHSLEVVSGGAIAAIFGNASTGAVGMGSTGAVPFIQGYTGVGAAAGANLILQPSGGNVGIGTAAPGSLFAVIAATNATTIATANQITVGEPTNNPGYRLSLGYGSIGAINAGVVQSTAGAAGAALLLNPSGGNVGIGTAAPWAPLTVGSAVANPSLTHQSPASAVFSALVAGANTELALFHSPASPYTLVFQTRHSTVDAQTFPLALNPLGGNVGIGTAAPGGSLHVHQASGNQQSFFTAASGNGSYIEFGVVGSTAGVNADVAGNFGVSHFGIAGGVMLSYRAGAVTNTLVLNSGRVGIGTTAPAATLSVNAPYVGVANTLVSLSCNYTNAGDYQQIRFSADQSGAGIIQSAIRSIRAATAAYGTHLGFVVEDLGGVVNERMRITAAGNVGIGTNNPLSLLSVVPTATITTLAQAQILTICEPGNNSGYRLSLGYLYDASAWKGCIQSTQASVGGALLLNPSGGGVYTCVPNGNPGDPQQNSQMVMFYDEANNRVAFRVRNAAGNTLKIGYVTVS